MRDKQKRRESDRKWRAANRERLIEYERLRRIENPERKRKHYHKNAKEICEKAKLNRLKNPELAILNGCRARAKQCGFPFDLTIEDILIPEVCPITLLPLSFTGPKLQRPSVDRIIPARGYVRGNIKIISFKANMWKSNMLKIDIQRLLQYLRDNES